MTKAEILGLCLLLLYGLFIGSSVFEIETHANQIKNKLDEIFMLQKQERIDRKKKEQEGRQQK